MCAWVGMHSWVCAKGYSRLDSSASCCMDVLSAWLCLHVFCDSILSWAYCFSGDVRNTSGLSRSNLEKLRLLEVCPRSKAGLHTLSTEWPKKMWGFKDWRVKTNDSTYYCHYCLLSANYLASSKEQLSYLPHRHFDGEARVNLYEPFRTMLTFRKNKVIVNRVSCPIPLIITTNYAGLSSTREAPGRLGCTLQIHLDLNPLSTSIILRRVLFQSTPTSLIPKFLKMIFSIFYNMVL